MSDRDWKETVMSPEQMRVVDDEITDEGTYYKIIDDDASWLYYHTKFNEAQAKITGEIAFKVGQRAERERLIKEGLLTEKQWIFKTHNALKANPDRVFAQLFKYIHEEEFKAGEEQSRKEIIDTLKNYGISITNEGISVPCTDEWEYLYDTPRRVLLRGNDRGESAKNLVQG